MDNRGYQNNDQRNGHNETPHFGQHEGRDYNQGLRDQSRWSNRREQGSSQFNRQGEQNQRGYANRGYQGENYGNYGSEFRDWRSNDQSRGYTRGSEGQNQYRSSSNQNQSQGSQWNQHRPDLYGMNDDRTSDSYYQGSYSEHFGPFGESIYGPREGMQNRFSSPVSSSSQQYGQQNRGDSFQRTRGAHYGKGPKGYQPTDDELKRDVCRALAEHDEIDASDIDVNVTNGEVILSGTVDSRDTKYQVEELVEDRMFIKDVNNQLRVKKGILSSLFGTDEEDSQENSSKTSGSTSSNQRRSSTRGTPM